MCLFGSWVVGSQRVEHKQPATGCHIAWTHVEADGGNKFPKQRTKAGAGSSIVTQPEGPMHLWEEKLPYKVREKCADTGGVSLLALNCPSRLQIWPVGLREECHNGRLQRLNAA